MSIARKRSFGICAERLPCPRLLVFIFERLSIYRVREI